MSEINEKVCASYTKMVISSFIKGIDLSFRSPHNLREFYLWGIANRIPLYVLHLIRRQLEGDYLKIYTLYFKKYNLVVSAIRDISRLLNKSDIKYIIIKSIRPYPATTVDIDIAVDIKGQNELVNLNRVMIENGYILYTSGPQSITYYDTSNDIFIDFYVNHVTASRIIYFDNSTLFNHAVTLNLFNTDITILDPCYEIPLIAGHSLFKEQMITAADVILIIDRLNKCRNLMKAVNETNSLYEVSLLLSVVKESIFGSVCLPIKINVSHLIRTFNHKISHKLFRRSLIWEVDYMVRYRRFGEVIKYVIEHIRRFTY